MVSQRLKKHANELVYLQKARPCIRKHLITKADRSLVDCLCECADNILRGNVPLTKLQKKKLAKNKAGLRALTKKSFSQKEESDLTERWIFGMPTSTDCLCSSTVALYFASMKELNLMNRYHQTRGRPKPPVEQRVKVMDTLDKKIQSILEREDLSTDERLKLYDQSFTRYLNVHDDYRPQAMLGSASIFRTNSSALVFIVFGTLSNISSSIASFVSVSITAGGDVDTLDTTGLGL
jgi:hypothetical protein